MKEISDWLDETYLKLDEKENKYPRRSVHDFLQRYVFCDAYEILFSSIHIALYQWLSRLTERRTNFQSRRVPTWTPQGSILCNT